jgi:ribosomal-protein-alanine N-acetyltransferase
MKASLVTLETRVSNASAQALYEKYGFNRVGTRRRYYSDNGEDAVIMTTESITSPAFQARFGELERKYIEKYGQPEWRLARPSRR